MKEGFGKEFPFLSLEDREKIENKYHKKNEPFNPFNRMDYHGKRDDLIKKGYQPCGTCKP